MKKKKEHYVVIIPGLFEDYWLVKFITKDWKKKFGLTPYIFYFAWKDKKRTYQQKLSQARNHISNLLQEGDVSLIGRSAGGSAVMNLFLEKQDTIKHVVNISGRLSGSKKDFLIADKWRSQYSESVFYYQKNKEKLEHKNKRKILTIRALYDELVPIETVPIHGARNIQLVSVEHALTGILVLTLYRKIIINFLRG